MRIGDRSIHVGASIGIATHEDSAHDVEDLLISADREMREAKSESRGSFRIGASKSKRLDASLIGHNDLKTAIDRNEITLVFQPIFDAKTLEVRSAEVLARWRHDSIGQVPPSSFVPLAERSGLIVDLGEKILNNAIEVMSCHKGMNLAVNVSPVQFRRHGFALRVQELLHAHNVEPSRLEIEVTETALISGSDIPERTLRQLRDVGVKVALDDFGTGFSNLSYLQRLVFDKVKLDQSFVRNLAQQPANSRLVRAIIDMGHGMGMAVVAEGIETQTQAGLLQLLGCDLLQGYALGLPVSEAEYCAAYLEPAAPVAPRPTLRRAQGAADK